MIDRTLPRMPTPGRESIRHSLEAFTVVYLSKYNRTAIPARVTTSICRAWDFDQVQSVQRVGGGRPAYAIGIHNDANLKRVTIGIEGMTTVSQIWGPARGLVSESPFNTSFAVVFEAFNNYSATIYAELLANNAFMAAFNHPTCHVVVSGMSLGAGIAEVLCARFKKDYPLKTYDLYKFGSPKVGSTTWVNEFANPRRMNIYCVRDPINQLPWGTPHTLWDGGPPIVWNSMTFYANNSPQTRLDITGDEMEGDFSESYQGYVRACVNMRQIMDENNPLFWHDYDQYRVMLTAVACLPGGVFTDRFRYLEYDDDNQWGQRYIPGLGLQPAMKVLADPAPEPFVTERQPGLEQLPLRTRGDMQVNVPDEVQTPVQQQPTRQFANPAWRPRRSSHTPLGQR